MINMHYNDPKGAWEIPDLWRNKHKPTVCPKQPPFKRGFLHSADSRCITGDESKSFLDL